MRNNALFYFINGCAKNEMNSLMTKAFGLSLTKEVLKIEELEKYSGLRL